MDNENKLLVLSRNSGLYAQLVEELAFDDLDIVHTDSPSHADTYLNECNIILGEPSKIAPVIHGAGRLVWVQSTWAGVNELVKPDMRTDYTLTGVKGIFGPMMSEYVFGYIFLLERRILEMHAHQKKKALATQHVPYASKPALGCCRTGVHRPTHRQKRQTIWHEGLGL